MADLLGDIAQPGDRWDVTDGVRRLASQKARGQRDLSLPLDPAWDALLDAGEPIALVAPTGNAIAARYDPDRHALAGAGIAGLLGEADPSGRAWYLELEPSPAPRFRLLAEPIQAPRLDLNLTTERGVRLSFAEEDFGLLRQPPSPQAEFELSRQAAAFAASPGFDELISLPLLREVELYPHQLKTAKTVLRRFRGRALLCDEVGLGKTIEAGMILLELLMRKLARRVLILTPSSLVEQWRGEMSRKFGLDFIAQDDDAFREAGDEAWGSFDRILASYHKARREPHRSLVAGQDWDMVIVDEAHHFRNRNTVLWKFANSLRKKYTLLLTATPVQNNLDELYNLVTLLQPGLLSTAKRFQQQFVDRHDKLAARNLNQLHDLLAEAMVRNRRSNVSVGLTRRYAQTFRVEPLPEERALYEQVTAFVRSQLREGARRDVESEGDAGPPRRAATRETHLLSRMALITLQKELGSSSLAAAATLERLASARGFPAAQARTLRDAVGAGRTADAQRQIGPPVEAGRRLP